MNRYILVLGIGLMVSPLLSNFASSAVPASPKIAVIDMEKTLSETQAGKRANDAFEKTRKAKQAELDKQQEELKKAEADLDKQSALLKPDVLHQKKTDLEKKFVALQQTYVKLERDLAGEKTKLIQDLLKQASPHIERLAKQEGVTIIIDQNALVWSDKSVDLTEQLNQLMK